MGMNLISRIVRTGAMGALATGLLIGGGAATAGATASPTPPTTPAATDIAPTAVGNVCYSALPAQAYDTLNLIARGGPYPFPQDGTTFYNREGLLPPQSSGYYKEYTVITPGSSTRGARRIVTGNSTREDYYTADHYASFRLINYGC
ncbi:ribonuclease domain-containing protein [Streptomyces xiamenensis]|jgi:ribonuclease T1|nr:MULTISPECIES: ribonuclease domain-containing protein [unclassified Streptomyces]MCU4746420.1 ribonuclease [Streptomyces sp. G-5]QQN76703.1 ribonuclease [Streptomyces sp. XC 2026]